MKLSKAKIILPSLLTSANLSLGIGAVLLCVSARGAFAGSDTYAVLASWMIVAASMMDSLDGKVARMTRTATQFGIQYDSLADLVAFGVAPAALLYSRFLTDMPRGFVAIPMLFAISGAVRLARFNVGADGKSKQWFTGLPIPSAGGMIAAYVLLIDFLQKRGIPFAGSGQADHLVLFLALLNAGLMVSTLKFDVFNRFFFRNFSLGVRVVVIGIILFGVVRYSGPTLFGLGVIYILQAFARWFRGMIHPKNADPETKEKPV